MLINGRPNLACRSLTQELPEKITLMPLPIFKLVGDLSVDTGCWFKHLNLRYGGWIHTDTAFDPKSEERMDNPTALKIYEAERCIECGCCIAACGMANMREDFMGAAGFNHVARFLIDPRDRASPGPDVRGGGHRRRHLRLPGAHGLRLDLPRGDSPPGPTGLCTPQNDPGRPGLQVQVKGLLPPASHV